MSGIFERAFQIVVGHEGGFDATRGDPGNWTSGIVGVGRLRGTKFGVSAAAYPEIPIADLTLAQAQLIFKRDYWDHVRGDDLPPTLALLVFDAAINNGATAATRWLQAAVETTADGLLGPVTVSAVADAVQTAGLTSLCARFQARRIYFMGCLPNWHAFGRGWSERLSLLPYQSLTLMKS